LTLLACPAAAQSPIEGGIRAVLQGDYHAAARILRPLADDPARPDPVAEFFLAILYDTGRGVQRDMGRACALFLHSSAASHPLPVRRSEWQAR
jgi:TPR repeat protein